MGNVKSRRVYLLLLSGELADAEKFVAGRYPGHECVVLSKRELREGGWRGQIRALRKIQGAALVYFLHSLSDLQEPQLTVWSSLLHGCRSTVLADSSGAVLVYGGFGKLVLLPKALVSALADAIVFAAALLLVPLLRAGGAVGPAAKDQDADLDLAYLYPFPLDSLRAGGALSHVEGFLGGVASSGGTCEVFSGRSLPAPTFLLHRIPAKRQLYLFRESLMLSYNLRFTRAVCRLLQGRKVAALYQRHGRFLVAGVLLSWYLKVPLILEYNGSEVWVANHWDAARFSRWMRLCEQASIRCAHRIVVVSEASKQELLEQGIPEERILLNPNGVDPAMFHPDCGGQEVRRELGIAPDHVVVGFVGTFDRWHGMEVLSAAIHQLLRDQQPGALTGRLRFVLVGDGPLHAETRRSLQAYVGSQVLFTGLVPHQRVPAYLDAVDILVSPHVPMPDGKPFFGSPTKLFEYMAMGKGIVASNLDQLAQVLEHGQSARLVPPGNVSELAAAIVLLAQDPELRNQLGRNARAAALAHHTWKQNAERVLPSPRNSAAHGVPAVAVGAMQS